MKAFLLACAVALAFAPDVQAQSDAVNVPVKTKPGAVVSLGLNVAEKTSTCQAVLGSQKVTVVMSGVDKLEYTFIVKKNARAKTYHLVVTCGEVIVRNFAITVKKTKNNSKNSRDKLTDTLMVVIGPSSPEGV